MRLQSLSQSLQADAQSQVDCGVVVVVSAATVVLAAPRAPTLTSAIEARTNAWKSVFTLVRQYGSIGKAVKAHPARRLSVPVAEGPGLRSHGEDIQRTPEPCSVAQGPGSTCRQGLPIAQTVCLEPCRGGPCVRRVHSLCWMGALLVLDGCVRRVLWRARSSCQCSPHGGRVRALGVPMHPLFKLGALDPHDEWIHHA